MSGKSIKLFDQHTGGRYSPPLQDRLRAEAKELCGTAGQLLARASRLEAMADELDPPKPELGEVFRCDCRAELTFAVTPGGRSCWCQRCKARSEEDGAVVFVYGYGRDKREAFKSWREAVDRQ